MINIVCNMCKKTIPSPERGVNYFAYLNNSICEKCRDQLMVDIKKKMKSYDTYSYTTYKEEFEKMVTSKCR